MPFSWGAARLSIIQAPRGAPAAVRSLPLAAAVAASALTSLAPGAAHAALPAELKLDYAYYSPENLVIKRAGVTSTGRGRCASSSRHGTATPCSLPRTVPVVSVSASMPVA
ncbi:hypothetical protein J2797_006390 [Paraburkholderia terricola]|nr:hypothetical protein [Paraburkholderia terricola]